MTARRPLAIAATVLCGTAAAGCGVDNPYVDKSPAKTAPSARPAAAAQPADAAADAKRVATSYALAARSWTPATMRDQWQRQLGLSAGALRRQLRRVGPPTRAEVDAMRAKRSRSAAAVEDVAVRRGTATGRVTVLVELRERTTATDTIAVQSTRNCVTVQRGRDGRWSVVGFTIEP